MNKPNDPTKRTWLVLSLLTVAMTGQARAQDPTTAPLAPMAFPAPPPNPRPPGADVPAGIANTAPVAPARPGVFGGRDRSSPAGVTEAAMAVGMEAEELTQAPPVSGR